MVVSLSVIVPLFAAGPFFGCALRLLEPKFKFNLLPRAFAFGSENPFGSLSMSGDVTTDCRLPPISHHRLVEEDSGEGSFSVPVQEDVGPSTVKLKPGPLPTHHTSPS